jgi:transposase-like protein
MKTLSYKRHRFHPDIIRRAIWMYFKFNLSFRDIEDLMTERGVDVSYETIRRWVDKFGLLYAKRIRSGRRASSVWHLDEVYVKIDGKMAYLWRAVDDEGEVLDIVVQLKRNRTAALRLLKKLLRNQKVKPKRIVTDLLRSYGAALDTLGLRQLHETGHRKNNRVECSHVPIRRRERKAQGFKSIKSAQRILAAHGPIYNLFNPRRHLTSRRIMKILRIRAMKEWDTVTCAS